MHITRLLDYSNAPGARERRAYLYISAFCALAFAVEAQWIRSAGATSGSEGLILQCILAILAAAMAFAVLRTPVEEDPGVSSDSVDAVTSWRATRRRYLPAIELNELFSQMPERGRETMTRIRKAASPGKTSSGFDPFLGALVEFDEQAQKHTPKPKKTPQRK